MSISIIKYYIVVLSIVIISLYMQDCTKHSMIIFFQCLSLLGRIRKNEMKLFSGLVVIILKGAYTKKNNGLNIISFVICHLKPVLLNGSGIPYLYLERGIEDKMECQQFCSSI